MENERLKKIRVLVLDVDGVLTDGGIILDANGVETKRFDVQDGFGLVFWRKCGFQSAIISARHSKVIDYWANDLQIDKVLMGVYPKIGAYESLLKEWHMKDQEVCFVGDDVADLRVLKRVGFAAAVANAVGEIKAVAHYISTKQGGHGAVREIIELILKAKGQWKPELYEL